jgi:hypothetical protein
MRSEFEHSVYLGFGPWGMGVEGAPYFYRVDRDLGDPDNDYDWDAYIIYDVLREEFEDFDAPGS